MAAVSPERRAAEMRLSTPGSVPAPLNSVENTSGPGTVTPTCPASSAETLRCTASPFPRYAPVVVSKAAATSCVPAKTGRPRYVVLARSTSEAPSSSISPASAARSPGPLVPFCPATSCWRTRRRMEEAWVRVESADPSQVSPSSTLRPSCSVRACSPRSRIAAPASVGESEAREIRRPDESCSWVRCSRARLRLQAGHHAAVHRRGGDAHGHRRTCSQRTMLIRVSSVESIAETYLAAAE